VYGAGVFSDNPASLRVLEKLGFRLTGKKEQYFSMARLTKAESLLLERPALSENITAL
jgi:RimJ/RimL family protein N-acetyltransferase